MMAPPHLERLTWHLLSGKVQIHVVRAVKVAVRVSADLDGPLGGVVFVGFLIRGLLYLKHMIAPLIVLCPIVQIPFRHIGLIVVVAPKEVAVSVLLIELPCHIGVRGLGVFAQRKASFVILGSINGMLAKMIPTISSKNIPSLSLRNFILVIRTILSNRNPEEISRRLGFPVTVQISRNKYQTLCQF